MITLSEEEKEEIRSALDDLKDSTGFEQAVEDAVKSISDGINRAVAVIRGFYIEGDFRDFMAQIIRISAREEEKARIDELMGDVLPDEVSEIDTITRLEDVLGEGYDEMIDFNYILFAFENMLMPVPVILGGGMRRRPQKTRAGYPWRRVKPPPMNRRPITSAGNK